MKIIKPIDVLPALTLEFTGEEAQVFMEFLYKREPSRGIFELGESLFTQLHRAGYRRPNELT